MSTYDYDVIVLGGGSGGLAAAFRAVGHGARVAMLEPEALGGTCVNVGCVPKKAMWLAADLAEKVRLAAALGFDVPATPSLSWDALIERRQRYIDNIHGSYQRRLDQTGVVRIAQRGQLFDAHTVTCADGTRLTAEHIVIATGAHAMRPDVPGAELGMVSDDFFDLTAAPGKVAIVGGGYIAVELAGLLQALGSEVSLLVRGQRLLDRFDAELSTQLAENLRVQGVHVYFGCRLRELQRANAQLRVVADAGPDDGVFDQVFFATGRRPNSRNLGLEAAGIGIGDKEEVCVDAFQTTALASVHALGDVAGKVGLTPVAIAAARRLMDRLYGGQPHAKLDYENIASVVFSHPPLAVVGLSEQAARERYDRVSVYHSRFRPMLQSLADGPHRSLFKLVCSGDDERVVGIHLLGDGADEIMQGFAVALKLGVTRRQLEETVAIHPTSAEEVVLMN